MKVQPLRDKLREATWNAILEATEETAAEHGVGSTSLQAIADRAGVAVGTIYNYFSDKDQLFEALYARRREELYAAIDEATKAHAREPFAPQLQVFVATVFSHFDARRAFLRIALEADPARPQVVKAKDGSKQTAMQQLQDRAERVVRLGIREKQLRDEDPLLLATVLVSIVKGVLIARAQDAATLASQTEKVVSLFVEGAGK